MLDGFGCLMVLDNNDIFYLVDKEFGVYVLYFNVWNEFIDNFYNSVGFGMGLGLVEFYFDFVENGLFYMVYIEGGMVLIEDILDFLVFGNIVFYSVIIEWKVSDFFVEIFLGMYCEIMWIFFVGCVYIV